jgi:o-succinylbenzoate synthase
VRLAELRWTPYALPFSRDFVTARGATRVREGAVVRVVTDDGVTGTGEIAPLPSHGTLALDAQLAMLESLADQLLGVETAELPSRLDVLLGARAGYGPIRCAVGTAALDAAADVAGVSLATQLSSAAAASVRVNAVIDAASCADAAAAAGGTVARGFRDIKLKVGAAGDAVAEAARVAAVRAAVGPDVRLRLDANGAWSEDVAIATLRLLEQYGIDLVEQPVAVGDITSLVRVRRATGIPIAADESVSDAASVRALIDAAAVDAVVIKLPVVGGPLRAMEIAAIARAAGSDVVITSALESGIGLAAALHVAAALLPARACGLATLDLLEDDLIAGVLPVESGRISVPRGPGLGVCVDEGALARYAAGPERAVRA